ncbi:MAG: hypothetical protein LKE48_05845 [Solobacterium sp.]|jgi:hypothetical protein|nr:hypothetical protein [Solobacterium sp.]
MEIITATELKRRKWVELIMECNETRKARDISVTEFCTEKGVSEKSYWYYHKKIGDQLATTISKNMEPVHPNEISFAPLESPAANVSPAPGQAVIEKNGVRIMIDDNISDELLMRLMKAMSNV